LCPSGSSFIVIHSDRWAPLRFIFVAVILPITNFKLDHHPWKSPSNAMSAAAINFNRNWSPRHSILRFRMKTPCLNTWPDRHGLRGASTSGWKARDRLSNVSDDNDNLIPFSWFGAWFATLLHHPRQSHDPVCEHIFQCHFRNFSENLRRRKD
jgi:hypothetical protein